MSTNSVARTLRLQKVRETSVSSTAILEKKHRKVYDLAPVRPVSKGSSREREEAAKPGRSSSISYQDGTVGKGGSKVIEATPDVDDSIPLSSNRLSDKDLEDIVWSSRSLATKPVSLCILKPELDAYHKSLSAVRLKELEGRVKAKVAKVSESIKTKYKAHQTNLNSTAIFHPTANAHRSHTLTLTSLHKHLSPSALEIECLEDMVRDDTRDLSEDEKIKLGEKFGKMLKGTALGTAISDSAGGTNKGGSNYGGTGNASKTVEEEFSLSGTAVDSNKGGPASGGKTIKELKDKKILDFDTFKERLKSDSAVSNPTSSATKSRPLTSDEGFKSFNYMRTQQHRADTRRRPDKDPLVYNKSGTYSNLLQDDGRNSGALIGEDVNEKLWYDSERNGKRPSYKERHSDVEGFKNDFISAPNNIDDGLADGRISPESAETDDDSYDGCSDHNDNVDNKAAVKVEGSPPKKNVSERASRASLLRKKKSSARKTLNDEESNALSSNNAIKDAVHLQARIESTWTILEMPMIKKLQFLQKYCDQKYSMLLPRAVELFEKAAVVVPLREMAIKRLNELNATNRIGLKDLEVDLDMDGKLTDIGCMMELPDSFYFEKKVEQGGLSDAELLLVEETFEDRVSGKELAYAKDLKAWLGAILDRLDDFCLDLMADMQEEIDEKILWKGLVYVIKRRQTAVREEEDKT